MISSQVTYPVTGHDRAAVSARVFMTPPTSVILGVGVCPQATTPFAADLMTGRLDAIPFRSQLFRTRNDKPRTGFTVWIPPA